VRGLLIKNRERALFIPTYGVLGMEFAYLARLGLRSATDTRLTDTIPLVDALLGRRTGAQSTYLRYNFDGYGELIDGSNWDNLHGLGRPWPILAGERGNYEVAAGRTGTDQMLAMLETRTATGYLPEQVWDQPPIPRYAPGTPAYGSDVPQPAASLRFGEPSLSATPLVWAHAELVKLACARAAGKPVEILPSVESHLATPRTPNGHWRAWHPFSELAGGRALYIEDPTEFELSYSLDGGPTQSSASSLLPLGLQGVVLTADELAGHSTLVFRLRLGEPEHQIALNTAPRTVLRAHSHPTR
jgi:glucoamylase